MTLELYSLRILGISSLLSPQKLIHQGAYCTMSTPIPPGHQEKPVLHVGGRGQAPWPARLHSLLWPHYHSEALLANLLVRLVQLGIAWPHWPGAAPPGQISCLALTKGCQAGWVQKTCVANFIRKQFGPRTVTTTVLCIVWASRLLRNQRRPKKRVRKLARITVLL